MKKAIFWDFDGTLIHSNRSFFDSLKYSLELEKAIVSDDAIMNTLKTTCSWYMPDRVYPDETGAAWWRHLLTGFSKLYDDISLSQVCRDRVNGHFRARILDPTIYRLYSECFDVLGLCRGLGYDNYILSNNFPELPRIIADLGLSEYILHTLVSSSIGYEKPHPQIFLHALDTAKHPDICYMIGDNPIADIEGGKKAGMKTILVHSPDNTDSHTLRDIPSLLL